MTAETPFGSPRSWVGGVIGVTGLVVAGIAFLLTPPPLPAGGVRVIVRDGETLPVVANRLARAGVIRNALVFRWWARYHRLDRAIQPGDYRFADPAPATAVLRVLAAGSEPPEVTIPEGLTVRETASLLAARGLGSERSFLSLANDPDFLRTAGVPGPHLEGYLFPDTYRFTPVMGPAEILAAMVRRFHERFDASRHRRTVERGMRVDQLVTLASIIEKETGRPAERPLVAAVFYNRLKIGMPLQSDPTVVYDNPSPRGGPITRADLARPSPYNTYVSPGLPPGAIANPGLAAIDAALAPADAPYLYFVSRNDGSHEFSTTLAEHHRAVDRYQR